MIKKYANILSWIAGTLVILAGAFGAGVKYISWQQINFDRAAVADTTQLSELRSLRKDFQIFQQDYVTTKNTVNILEGWRTVMDQSYVRMLEKQVKTTDELNRYKDEKIQALEEALKKNSLKIPRGG